MAFTLMVMGGAMVLACCYPLIRTVFHNLPSGGAHSRSHNDEDGSAAPLTAPELDGPDALPPSPQLVSSAPRLNTRGHHSFTFD
jgi:hypothetical protein